MASGEVSGAIEDYLLTAWTTTPLLFENKTEFERGAGVAPPSDPIAFVEVSFTGRSYGQESIGIHPVSGNRWDEEGIVFFDVLVPVTTGSRTARTYAKSLANLFRGKVDLLNENLEFMDASIGQGEKSAKYNGNYFVIPVDLEWRRVEA
jgi:hypothetical protein